MREIKGYPGYTVTECGKVFDPTGAQRPEYLSGIPAYKYVNMPSNTPSGIRNGGWQIKRVHILVAQTYIPNPDNLPMVNHIDEDKMNCHYLNLEWCTRSHNTLHSRGSRTKGRKQRPIYTEEQRREIVARFKLTGGSKRKTYMALDVHPAQFDRWLDLY